MVNAVGNYLLIFGHLGFPEMGIAGAAVATVIGWGVRAGILTVAILLPEFDRKYNTRHSMAFDGNKVKGMLRVGLPTTVQWLVDIGAWLVFLAVIMPGYGVHAAAASNVGLQYMHLSFMPALGIGIALCSQVGFAIGEGRPEQAVLKSRVAMRLTGIYMGAIGLLFVLAGRQLMGLMNDDPQVIDAGVWVLIGVAIFQIFDAMCITYTNSLRGAGDTRWPRRRLFCLLLGDLYRRRHVGCQAGSGSGTDRTVGDVHFLYHRAGFTPAVALADRALAKYPPLR